MILLNKFPTGVSPSRGTEPAGGLPGRVHLIVIFWYLSPCILLLGKMVENTRRNWGFVRLCISTCKVYGLNNMLKGLCWASCFFFQARVLPNTSVLIVPNCPNWTEMAAVRCSALHLPYSDALLESRILCVIWLPKHQVVPGLLLSSLYFPSALGKASHHFFLGILACISQLLPWLQGNSQLRRVLDINLLPNSPQKPTLNCVMS